ncbi:hypothetical protein [Sphingomonas corticis]|uniref:Lipoprotein n=1 Tax=Sphingomonas corticis TaxID=2722791 RepID=A0ABX1CLF2_9SPHN|nr:hypothetical protein [Sphingomonas corticis]NJR77122.1 hypothetical protein [Sphingomonas corticis]
MTRALAGLLLLAGCGSPEPQADRSGGAALEQAARARGLVAADGQATPVGVYRNGGDQVCVVPAGGGYRVGASVDYGEGQRCVARGSASGRAPLSVDAGEGCRFDVQVDADRVTFPAVLPAACDAACTGRASLTALTAERLSDASAEARQVRGADGRLLCGD